MSSAQQDRVVFRCNGQDEISLRPEPSPNDGYGVRTVVEIVSASLRAQVIDDLWYVGEFKHALEKLYETLDGNVELHGEGWFTLELQGNGRGGIVVHATAKLRPEPEEVTVEVRSRIDQTFLPDLIAGIEQVFLSPPRPGSMPFYPKSTRIG